MQVRKTAYRVRLGASLRRRNRQRLRLRLRSRFEGSFEKSFDASFRPSFAASDARSNALSFETSDARCDVTSFELSNGRCYEVRFRVCILRYFPANSEASFLASFQGSFPERGNTALTERRKQQKAAGKLDRLTLDGAREELCSRSHTPLIRPGPPPAHAHRSSLPAHRLRTEAR